MSPEEIREVREGLGLSRTELAAILGVGRTVTAHWELGIRKPSGMALSFLNHLKLCLYGRPKILAIDELLSNLKEAGNYRHPVEALYLSGKGRKSLIAALKKRGVKVHMPSFRRAKAIEGITLIAEGIVDAIGVFPGWEKDEQTRLEVAVATVFDVPIFDAAAVR
jgi:transcriptional regulator with XRE-family HTH domain